SGLKLPRIESNTCCGVEASGSFDAALAALKLTAIKIDIVATQKRICSFIVLSLNQDRLAESNRLPSRYQLRSRLQRRSLSSAPIFRVSGQRHATPSTTRMVPIPPATTEITVPKRATVKPDSSAPNSFDVPMKMYSRMKHVRAFHLA